MFTTILTICGTVATALVTYIVAKMNVNLERQKYYENKVSEILELQSKEIKNLKDEIEKLVKENQWLRHQLEKKGMG